LNPILSAKNSGAPVGAGAMAQTPDFSKAYSSGVANALMIAQTRKTNAEATLVEDQKNRAQLESDFYGSVAGMPTVAAKTLGGAGTAYGTYRARMTTMMTTGRTMTTMTHRISPYIKIC
jgi:hypothetical protein